MECGVGLQFGIQITIPGNGFRVSPTFETKDVNHERTDLFESMAPNP
jgi:hypothetical protein